MPRSARVVLPGFFHHIVQRGNFQQNVFEDDSDRKNYLFWLNENSQKFGLNIIAYCLLSNHVHIIASPEHEKSFAESFRVLNTKYSHYFNNKKSRQGHLWQGRYFSCVLNERHFYSAVKYVERNPVRAGLVQYPWDWLWSSAREHVGLGQGIVEIFKKDDYFHGQNWKEYLTEDDEYEGTDS